MVDGIENCNYQSVSVDKDGVMYGILSNGTMGAKSYLVAYQGNTLLWKYSISCQGWWTESSAVVGGDGNIYALTAAADGTHLIGITPDAPAGQTEPAKILDIKSPYDCAVAQLSPYSEGLIVRGGLGSHLVEYYSYQGQNIAEVPTDTSPPWVQANALGQTFFYDGQNVSMFDPTTKNIAWSVPIANASSDLAPLPDGGVSVLTSERTQSPQASASSTTMTYSIITLNASGQRVRAYTLQPAADPGTGYVGPPELAALINGNVLVLGRYSERTAHGFIGVVEIGIYNPTTDGWVYRDSLRGDVQDPSPYGFTALSRSVKPTKDTVYVPAFTCPESGWGCSSTAIYPLKASGAALDYPRGAILTSDSGPQHSLRSYVALGDSFSSGEGVPPFLDNTACHRSTDAYSQVLSRDPLARLQLKSFVACSGAETKDVLANRTGQAVAITKVGPQLATMTIGGNDIDFAGFATACVLKVSCGFSSAAYRTAVTKINTVLGPRLEHTYRKLLDNGKSAGTDIYVLGYPYVISNKSASAPYDGRCGYMYGLHRKDRWEEAHAATSVVTQLNAKISATVARVQKLNPDYSRRLHFISATASNSPFRGHEICSTETSYFQNINQVTSNYKYIFHPNRAGEAAYAQLVRMAIGQ
ncbi:SGNH/GDSL hydrolase family protein [Kribbella solani]|uniref:SGNH/GDSL hydrolase family protein n=1 Tax=Kribbella solani TaxID=236067 RepID=UPI0029AADE01|nr:SGNH/GDSL hydrolase family protein [Kribbella solani]MDX2972369.1 SGNH/GDSL hydrolase family protein [Kribbella solani]